MKTLEEKLRYLEEHYPEAYQVLCSIAPNLVLHPDTVSESNLSFYNSMIDGILDDYDAEQLYHYES